ncbi:MAG: 50S ribosomal protein L11 [Thermogladius sp.]|uniref:Large ribosomal subunit protein uL11 n=1 Tax=Thermogladius calderae TaxID=1200300 RepID=A0A7J3XXC6_9CREN|nr:50S ribosomal protein L11 [Thermogladius sp.]
MGKKVIRVMVEGGKATPGPPLGPTLSPLKLNVGEVVKAINEATKGFEGLSVPVEIHVDTTTKEYEIKVGVPTTTALLLKEAGAKEFTGDPAHQKIGDLKMEQVVKVALLKKDKLTAKTLKAAVKTVLGTARSIGLTVEGKDPREVQKLVDEGYYDELLNRYESEWEKEVS